jgi:hypothetical protein
MSKSARVIAFYLPQYHPIPENDEWWGRGFTEWTNTAKAKPLFKGHYQPHIPADLGYYDLRVPETRIAQAEMAREHGIEGFCYYHYWFAGKRLIERPFNEVLASGEPDFPFCLCWANHTWTGIWLGEPNRVLIEQTYPGMSDYENHFYELLKAFTDDRYIRVEGKPIFLIYDPHAIPDLPRVLDHWRELAVKVGLKGLYLVGVNHDRLWTPAEFGLDASMMQKMPPLTGRVSSRYRGLRLKALLSGQTLPTVYSYAEMLHFFLRTGETEFMEYPCVVPNWDNTPRSGISGMVLHDSTPELFRQQLKMALDMVASMSGDCRIVFLKAWNEWAEGNYVEPDLKYGKGYLEVIRDEILVS